MFRFLFTLLLSQFILGCGHLFYYPDNVQFADPKSFDLKYESIEFFVDLSGGTSGPREKLAAWYFPATKKENCDTRPLIVHFHGNAQNISSHFFQLAWAIEHGVEVLIVDYPGFGASDGEANRENIHSAMVQFLDQVLGGHDPRWRNRPIILYGQSLGGTILLGVLRDVKNLESVRHVFIEASFASYQRIARRKLAHIWLTWPFQWLPYLAVSDRYSIDKKYKTLSLPPITVIHGEDDVVVPFREGKELYEFLPDPKQFWAIPKANHLQPLHPSFGLREKLLPIFCAK